MTVLTKKRAIPEGEDENIKKHFGGALKIPLLPRTIWRGTYKGRFGEANIRSNYKGHLEG